MIELTEHCYRVSEVANMLGVHRMTIYRYIESGAIVTLLVNLPHRIPKSEVEKLLSPDEWFMQSRTGQRRRASSPT